MSKRILATLLLAAAASIAPHALANETARALFERAQGDAELRTQLTEAGKAAAFFCANCHGEQGISKLGDVPNLAGQHPAYILEQISAFLSGRRKNDFMQGLMKVLSEEDKVAIAYHYAAADAVPTLPEPGPRAAEGKQLYEKFCSRCHLDDASGAATFPRLAGQQPEYMRLSLKRYFDMSGERLYPPMTGAVRQLGEDNIQAVVDYLSAKR